ncbi:MAG: aspartate 1-decarboxylase [Clostridiales bacterium]
MYINMMKSKIHRATVTEADLNYVGSITIDKNLMKEANLLENEKVQIVNNNNGKRFETYIIEGEEDSRTICLNGAAARLVQPGDKIIIISYILVDRNEAYGFKPKIIVLDDDNNVEQVIEKEEHGKVI